MVGWLDPTPFARPISNASPPAHADGEGSFLQP